jgi:hypothetical protein
LKFLVVVDGSVSTSEYPPVAIGWGQKAEHIRVLSEELQQVTLQTIAYESYSCQRQLLDFEKSRQFCASVETGGKGKK